MKWFILQEENLGGTHNSSWKNISYTLTENDINKNYNYYLLNILVNGADNVSYANHDNLVIPDGSITILNDYQSFNTDHSLVKELQLKNMLYKIFPEKVNGVIFSINIRGHYSIFLIGVK